MGDFLALAYPWTKSLHIMSVIAWMAGLFYLPRLFVYHAERATAGTELAETLKVMEHKLLKVIINPAGVATWIFGLALAFTPGVIDWSYDIWAWVKAALVIGMTWYHHALVKWTRSFAGDANERPGRYYRLMNEVPTLLMIGIVIMVIVKPF
ncbi:MAG: protoporphyrinogen oxidase HemJ [Pseudomonadota bacterium]